MTTMPPMKILRCTLPQLPDARLLLAEYYEAIGVVYRDTPEMMASYLSDAGSGFWMASVEGELAGCVALRPLPSVALAAECKRLYVRPQFRGQRLAGGLLDALENHAAVSEREWIYLDSDDRLQDALRLYAARGYQSCERYNDNPEATVFMRKRLGQSAAAPSPA